MDVLRNLEVSRKDPAGDTTRIKAIEEAVEDLQAFLNVFKPILTSAMGKMGENFHFFVFEDGKKMANASLTHTSVRAANLKPGDSGDLNVGWSQRHWIRTRAAGELRSLSKIGMGTDRPLHKTMSFA